MLSMGKKVYSSEQLLCMDAAMLSDEDDEDTYRPIPINRNPAAKPSQPWSETCVFQGVVGLVIMLNTVVIVLQTIYIHHEVVWTFLERVELVFLAIYVIELLWRVCDHGCGCFARGPRWTLNWFDVMCVVVGITEICRARMLNDKNSGALVARLFRVSRTLRIFRCLRFVSEIDYVIVTAARAALALAVLMTLMLFVAAIFTTNILWDAPDGHVREKFGHLGASMWSLYQMMSMDGWIETANHVIAVNHHTLWFFVIFIFSTSFSLMALAPAVLIEVNTRHRERAQHLATVQRCRQRLQNEAQVVGLLFRTADAGSGLVTVGEMQDLAADSTVLRPLEKLGLSTSGALRDVRLGLFDLQEELLAKDVPPDFGFNEEDVLERVLFRRNDAEQVLWRSATATRMQLHDLSSFLHSELQQQRQEIQQLRDAMRGRVDLNLEAVEAAAARGASEAGASMRREIERLCSEMTGRAAGELAALAELAAAKVVAACAQRPPEAQQQAPSDDGSSRPCSAFGADECARCPEEPLDGGSFQPCGAPGAADHARGPCKVPAGAWCPPGTAHPAPAAESGGSTNPSLASSHIMAEKVPDFGLGEVLQCQAHEDPTELSSLLVIGPDLARAQPHGAQEQPAARECGDEPRSEAPAGDAEAPSAAGPPAGTREQQLHSGPAAQDSCRRAPATEDCGGGLRRRAEHGEVHGRAPPAAQSAQDLPGPGMPELGGAQAVETQVAPHQQREPQSTRRGEETHGES